MAAHRVQLLLYWIIDDCKVAVVSACGKCSISGDSEGKWYVGDYIYIGENRPLFDTPYAYLFVLTTFF